jgi:hypothetical protein
MPSNVAVRDPVVNTILLPSLSTVPEGVSAARANGVPSIMIAMVKIPSIAVRVRFIFLTFSSLFYGLKPI